jgi:hypothetical protein
MLVDKWLETLTTNKIISEHEVKQLCDRVKEIFMSESNVQPVSAPVIICGDIHGQYYDLLSLFDTGGKIPNSRYIFMGDYVDRGYNSVETIELLLCLKLKYPGHITLLRGNHESRQICYSYGFYEEITKKYGNGNPWKYFTDIFDYMPIGAVVESNAVFRSDSVTPVCAGEIPAPIYPMVARVCGEQEELSDAIAKRDVGRIFNIFVNDPLVTCSLEDARTLFAKMLDNNNDAHN